MVLHVLVLVPALLLAAQARAVCATVIAGLVDTPLDMHSRRRSSASALWWQRGVHASS